MEKDVKKDKQYQFDCWLSDIPMAMERFLCSMPPEISKKLDFSLESLDVLEATLLNKYSSPEDIRNNSSSTLDGYVIYLGESFRHIFKNKNPNCWTIDLDNKKNIFYNLPMIHVGDIYDCPISMVISSLKRRQGNYFSSIANNFL